MTQEDPPAAWWRGKPIEASPRQLALLDLLCREGKADHLAIQMVGVGEDAYPEVARVQFCHLRKRLPPELRIENIRGKGYELVIDQELAV